MPGPLDRNMLDRRTLLVGAAAALDVVWLALPARAANSVGLITEVQGAAFLERAGDRLTATAKSDLFLKDRAITGDQPSRLELRLGAATRIRLGADATFQVDRLVAGLAASVRLGSGPALVERDQGAEPNFTLRSPFALLAARGTTFFAGPSNGVFGVFVREGEVEVRTRAGAVVVTAGQGTDIKAPGAAPTPVKVWGPGRVQAAMASVS